MGNKRIVWRFTSPHVLLRKGMREDGFRHFRNASPKRNDLREVMQAEPPQGWILESNGDISVIYDSEGTLRYVDFHGSMEILSGFYRVTDPRWLQTQVSRFYARHAHSMSRGEGFENLEGFAFYAWMYANRPEVLRGFLEEDATSVVSAFSEIPVLPSIPMFTVRQVAVGTTSFARFARP